MDSKFSDYWKDIIWWIVWLIILIPLFMAQMYLFYYAPCSKVKEYYYLVQTPGRCINLQNQATPTQDTNRQP